VQIFHCIVLYCMAVWSVASAGCDWLVQSVSARRLRCHCLCVVKAKGKRRCYSLSLTSRGARIEISAWTDRADGTLVNVQKGTLLSGIILWCLSSEGGPKKVPLYFGLYLRQLLISVETHFQCGGIYINLIIANCLQSVPVKEFCQCVNNWRRYGQK